MKYINIPSSASRRLFHRVPPRAPPAPELAPGAAPAPAGQGPGNGLQATGPLLPGLHPDTQPCLDAPVPWVRGDSGGPEHDKSSHPPFDSFLHLQCRHFYLKFLNRSSSCSRMPAGSLWTLRIVRMSSGSNPHSCWLPGVGARPL